MIKKEKWMDLKVDDKLTYLLKVALETNNATMLSRMAEIIDKRASFEYELDKFITGLQTVKE